MKFSKYTVWVEASVDDLPTDPVVEAIRNLPGYVDHEWIDWEEA